MAFVEGNNCIQPFNLGAKEANTLPLNRNELSPGRTNLHYSGR